MFIPFKTVSLLVVLSCIVLCSCNETVFKTKPELLEYVEDSENGYAQHKIVNGYDFKLMYRPTDLLVQQELGDNFLRNKIKSLRNKYNKYIYFNLSISRNNNELLSSPLKSRNEFGAMVNQLAFDMDKKVHLFTKKKDTSSLIDFIYPRMYGMSRATTMMFVYKRDENTLNEDYMNFTIRDLGLGIGEVKFKIDMNKIKNEPKISFKN